MALRFLDTNVFLRHLLQDQPSGQSPACTALIRRIESRELEVRITSTVVFEAVFTLQQTYKVPRAAIRDQLLPLVELPRIHMPGKRMLRRAFEHFVDLNLPFADAFHAATMERLGIDEIITYDRDFARVPGARRVEPADVP